MFTDLTVLKTILVIRIEVNERNNCYINVVFILVFDIPVYKNKTVKYIT